MGSTRAPVFASAIALAPLLGCDAILGLNAPSLETHDGGAGGGGTGGGAGAAGGGNLCEPGSGQKGPTCGDRTFAHWSPGDPKGYITSAETAFDSVTGLTWQRVAIEAKGSWASAKEYCELLKLTGDALPGTWRVPTRIELVSLIDYTKTMPAFDTSVFPDGAEREFWSSSVLLNNSSFPHKKQACVVHECAFMVNFKTGLVDAWPKISHKFRVRCVR